MEDVRQLVQEEGREARNLIAFHVSMDTPGTKLSRKPPKITPPSNTARGIIRRIPCRGQATRLRSASAGRDKRSELQARYWALLFGNLQRAIGEIYTTVESHENLSECQEVILVLENYTRDFQALCEWFRLKWEYDNTPPPQRPQSLAWEVRKTDFVRPESRKASSLISSPSVSGKNSPSISGRNTPTGKNSPNLNTGKVSPSSGKLSPRIQATSPKSNQEFFGVKNFPSKTGMRLSDIKETSKDEIKVSETLKLKQLLMVEIENIDNEDKSRGDNDVKKADLTTMNDSENDEKKSSETGLVKIADISEESKQNDVKKDASKSLTAQAKLTVSTLNKMEDNFIKMQNEAKKDSSEDNLIKADTEKPDDSIIIKKVDNSDNCELKPNDAKQLETKPHVSADKTNDIDSKINETKKPDPKTLVSDIKTTETTKPEPKPNEIKKPEVKPVVAKPAYSQAAAKPKAATSKTEIKPKTVITRSKTMAEIRSSQPRITVANRAAAMKRNVKCSYPFNLTTGRTTLFESTRNAKNTAKNIKDAKKPIIKPNKADGDKTCSKNDSNSTLTRIESNESVKTLVPEGGSVEVLSVKDDNDGWLTVKSRRLSRAETKNKVKSHWANRFNQPSATTSLPTLCMTDSPRQVSEEKVEVSSERIERKVCAAEKQSMIRQKSDVTGLRSRNRNRGGNKAAKTATKSDLGTNETRLHSSLESLIPMGLSRSQESTETPESIKQTWKLDFKLDFIEDENRLLNKTELFQNSDPFEMSEIAAMTNEIEENERKMSLALDFQSDFDQQKLIEEEDSLNRQIMELQTVSDFEIDIETDDTETDAEILCEDESKAVIVNVEFNNEEFLENASASSLENRYEPALANMSWADRMDTLAKLEALVARYPGRAQQLHAKLSQGIRRRGSLQETLKRCIIKQDRAERQRQDLQRERSDKIHQLLARVEDVKTAKNQLIEERRQRMEQRLQKAAENRDQHLKDRVRKAHDEEEKLKEIAFIKQLELENRRHDFLVQCKTRTQRLRQLRRDRLMRLEQKAEHSAAVGARRSALEAARIQRVTCILERTNHRAHRLKEQNTLKAKEKLEKAEYLRSRLSAMAAAAEAETESLRNKIQNKQEESKARHDIHLNAVRSRARPNTLQEVSEQTAKEEISNENQIELSKEKLKSQRRKMRKIKQKLITGGDQFELKITSEEFNHNIKLKSNKALSQIYKMLQPMLQLQENIDKTNKITTDENGKSKKKNKKEAKIKDNEHSETPKDVSNELIETTKEIAVETKKSNEELKQDLIGNQKTKSEQVEALKAKDGHIETQIQVSNVENLKRLHQNSGKSKRKAKKESKESTCDAIIESVEDKMDIEQNGEIICDKLENVQENSVKRKRQNKVDVSQRQTRVNSVGSSVSDVSNSVKIDDRHKAAVNSVDLNTNLLERSVNELWRNIDKIPANKNVIQNAPTLRILSGVLLLAAEKENCDITIKTLSTCLLAMQSILSTSLTCCMHFLNTNGPVYLVQNLINFMGKENCQDKEKQLTTSLADCLAVILESLNRLTKSVEDERRRNSESVSETKVRSDSEKVGANLVIKNSDTCVKFSDESCDKAIAVYELRQRAHTLISFILHSPFNQDEGSPSIDRLILSIANVCSPSILDPVKDSSERQSALSSLRAACSSKTGGSLAARTCSLLAAVAVEELKEDYSMFVASMRALAELDHNMLKECLGSGVEFRAAASKLLSSYAPSDRESQGNLQDLKPNSEEVSEATEKMLLDLIATIGYYAVDDDKCAWVPRALASLPASWLCGTRGRVVNCTLAALANTDDISVEMLDEFLDSEDAKGLKMVKLIKESRLRRKNCIT